MKYIILAIYIGLAGLHLFIVKNVVFLLILVGLFEAVRLVAVYTKVKPIVVILALFSIGFLGINYYTMYNNTSTVTELNKKLANNMDHYSSNYWTNQDRYMEMISKQEKIIDSINTYQLPNPIIVLLLIALIELSLAYMVIIKQNSSTPSKNKKKDLEELSKEENCGSKLVNVESGENVFPKNSHKEKVVFIANSQNSHLQNQVGKNGNFPNLFPETVPIVPNTLKLYTLGKGKVREYYMGNEKIPKSTYYRYLNEGLSA